MAPYKRDFFRNMSVYDVMIEFILCEIEKLCCELMIKLGDHNLTEQDRVTVLHMLEDFIDLESQEKLRLEEKNNKSNIKASSSYEDKCDLLQMALARETLTDNFRLFIQNTSTDLCKTIELELSKENALCKSEKFRYENLLGDFISIQLALSEAIDL